MKLATQVYAIYKVGQVVEDIYGDRVKIKFFDESFYGDGKKAVSVFGWQVDKSGNYNIEGCLRQIYINKLK
ncbi:MAG: hypothetical protein ACRDBG_12805 [Waterburya sp.]